MNQILQVQLFLRDSYEADPFVALTEQYGIKVRKYPEDNLVLLDYDQIESPKTHPIVVECRSLILAMDTLEVVSRKFDRFFNLGEAPELYQDFDFDRAVVMEKADGCLSEEVYIKTENGNKSIREICESRYNGKILAYDHLEEVDVWVYIQDYSIDEDESKQWYEITLTDGRSIRLTGNHKIWCSDIKCYRRVDELTGDEDLQLETAISQ